MIYLNLVKLSHLCKNILKFTDDVVYLSVETSTISDVKGKSVTLV